MEKYTDWNGDSGIRSTEVGEAFVRVLFKDGSMYLYTYASAGRYHVEQMKRLANQGDELNSYIMKNVQKAYHQKER